MPESLKSSEQLFIQPGTEVHQMDLITVSEFSEKLKTTTLCQKTHDDYFVSPVENADQYDVRGKMGRVIGFPGSWGDTMTEMNGRFTECRTSRRGQYTGVSLWYDIDQTGGNSGGPVFTIDSGLVS